MPEVSLMLEWPDGQATEMYSPSTVVLDYLKPGDEISIAKLGKVGFEALYQASERVRSRYGFACTRVDEEKAKLRRLLDKYATTDTVKVTQCLT